MSDKYYEFELWGIFKTDCMNEAEIFKFIDELLEKVPQIKVENLTVGQA